MTMKRNRNNSLLDRALLRRSLRESFIKLDPRKMVRNPIMSCCAGAFALRSRNSTRGR